MKRALLLACSLAWLASAAQGQPLTICLEKADPPLSSLSGGQWSGFDVLASQALAARMGRTLTLRWFAAGDYDADHSPVTETDALLASGLCDLVGGYGFYADALGRPDVATGTLPRTQGAPPDWRRRRVPLGTLVASHALRFAPMALILAPSVANRPIRRLADLKGLRVGAGAARWRASRWRWRMAARCAPTWSA